MLRKRESPKKEDVKYAPIDPDGVHVSGGSTGIFRRAGSNRSLHADDTIAAPQGRGGCCGGSSRSSPFCKILLLSIALAIVLTTGSEYLLSHKDGLRKHIPMIGNTDANSTAAAQAALAEKEQQIAAREKAAAEQHAAAEAREKEVLEREKAAEAREKAIQEREKAAADAANAQAEAATSQTQEDDDEAEAVSNDDDDKEDGGEAMDAEASETADSESTLEADDDEAAVTEEDDDTEDDDAEESESTQEEEEEAATSVASENDSTTTVEEPTEDADAIAEDDDDEEDHAETETASQEKDELQDDGVVEETPDTGEDPKEEEETTQVEAESNTVVVEEETAAASEEEEKEIPLSGQVDEEQEESVSGDAGAVNEDVDDEEETPEGEPTNSQEGSEDVDEEELPPPQVEETSADVDEEDAEASLEEELQDEEEASQEEEAEDFEDESNDESNEDASQEEELAESNEEEPEESYDDDADGDADGDGDADTPDATGTIEPWEMDAWNQMSSIQRKQVENFRKKNRSLILNVQIPHQGRSAMCQVIGTGAGSAPDGSCVDDRQGIMKDPPDCHTSHGAAHSDKDPPFCYSFQEMMGQQKPWLGNQTSPFLDAIAPNFQMITWDLDGPVGLGKFDHDRTLQSTKWSHPRLVSVMVTRDPLARLLAADHSVEKKFPGFNEGRLSRGGWWDYAVYKNRRETDNLALRILSTTHRASRTRAQNQIDNHVATGATPTTDELMQLFPNGIDETHYQKAKEVLDQFTFVLDIECLAEGMERMGKLLRMGQIPPQDYNVPTHFETPKERIGYDDVYEYLRAANEWDIKLYEYSKTISLVRCQDLPHHQRPAPVPAQAPTTTSTEAPTLELETAEPTHARTYPPTASPTDAGNIL